MRAEFGSSRWTLGEFDAYLVAIEREAAALAGPQPEVPPFCPCGGRCHHDTHPCSLGCWAAQKPWRVEESVAVAGAGLDVERLAVAMNTAQLQPDELRLGRDLRVPAARILAALGATPDPGPEPRK